MPYHKRNAIRIFATTLFIFALLYPIHGVFADDTPFQDFSDQDRKFKDRGMDLFLQVAVELWAKRIQLERTMSLLDQVETDFNAIEDVAARSYLLSQIELSRGRAVLLAPSRIRAKDKARARVHFEKSMELVQQSLDLYESADGYRVLADAGSAWMATKGLGGIIKMAPNVKEWSNKAIAINPENALSVIISSQGQIHAPKASGGNPQEAVRRLTELISRPDLSDIERFRAYLSLVQAHRKLKNKDKSAHFCEEAQKIFPNSLFLQQCQT